MTADHMLSRTYILVCVLLVCALFVPRGVFAQEDPQLAQADALLAKGDFQGAVEAYQAKLATDAKHLGALNGVAKAYLALNQPSRAAQMLERALLAAPKDRSIVHNLALVQFKNDSQPRAIKLVKDYLAANPKPADEPMLNTLLFMLGSASDATKKGKLHAECVAFADSYTKSIESQRPGMRRWGEKWEPAADVQARVARNAGTQKEIDKIEPRIRADEEAIARLEKQTPAIEKRVRTGFDSQYVLQDHLEAIRTLREQRQTKIDERQKLIDQIAVAPTPGEPTLLALGAPIPSLQKTEVVKTPPVQERPEPAPNKPPEKAPEKAPPAQVAENPPPRDPPAAAPKRVTNYGVAFAIGQDTLITSHDLVDGATEIVVQAPSGAQDSATLVRSDAKSGLAILRLKEIKAACLVLAPTFEGGAVQCVGMPTVDLFKADAVVIGGNAAAPKVPWAVKLDKNPRLPGAPLLANGKVVGVTLATQDTEPGAVPCVTLDNLSAFIGNDTGKRGTPSVEPKQAVFQLVVTHTK